MDVEELAARTAVVDTMSKYAYAWDHSDLELLADVLAEDCSIDYTLFGALDGRDALLEFAEAYFAGETRFEDWFHVFANPWIDVDDDRTRARGRWNFLGVYTFEAVGATWQAGFYDVGFVRTDDGWVIEDLTLEYKYSSPYDAGWDEVPIDPRFVD